MSTITNATDIYLTAYDTFTTNKIRMSNVYPLTVTSGMMPNLELLSHIVNGSDTLVKTGVVIDNNDTFKLEIYCTGVSGSFYMFQSRDYTGSQAGNSTPITGISGSTTGNTILAGPGTNSSQGLTSTITRTNGYEYHIIYECGNGTQSLYVKDVYNNVEDTQTSTFSVADLNRGSTEMCIYGNDSQKQTSSNKNRLEAGCRVYYAKLWKNGQLLLDLIPVYQRLSNNSVSPNSPYGFYNRVNGSFLTKNSSITGSLNGGNVIAPIPTEPRDLTCNNGVLRVSDKQQWTIFTNPTSIAGKGVYISEAGLWRAVNDRGAGVAIPLTIGKRYTMTIHKKDHYRTLGTILRYGQSPQIQPTSAGIQLTDWYRGTMEDGKIISFIAKQPYFVMQLSADASEAGMILKDIDVFEAQGIDCKILDSSDKVYDINNLFGWYTISYFDEQVASNASYGYDDNTTYNVTHKTGILVLDGTENWAIDGTDDYAYFRLDFDSHFAINTESTFSSRFNYGCTHFVANLINSSTNDSGIGFGSKTGTGETFLGIRYPRLYEATSDNLASFKAWLSVQYANGTPVMILYPMTASQSDPTWTITKTPASPVLEYLPLSIQSSAGDLVNASGYYTDTSVVCNGTYHNNPNIVSVDLQYVPWVNNNMVLAFKNCFNLVSVANINNSVTNMCETFERCYNLIDAPSIPDSVTNMTQTFMDCIRLVNAPIIPNNVTYLYETFYQCSNLVNAPAIPNVPGSYVEPIRTFMGCYNLVNVPDIPSSVRGLIQTFYQCGSLVNAPTIPNSVTNMSGTFEGCSSLINAPVIPNSVYTIDNAFKLCGSLVNAPIIPDYVNNMRGTFAYCSSLVNVPKLSNNVTDMSSTFDRCIRLVNIPTIPNKVVNMVGTFYGCESLIDAPIIPDSVTNMSNTFCYCFNLVNVPKLSNTVTNIDDTFAYCNNLVNVPDIPSSVTSMNNTFCECMNLSGTMNIYSSQVTDANNCFNDIYNYSRPSTLYVHVPANSTTYDSFVAAGYSTSTPKDDVLLVADL